jgi:hypothetical protein
MRRPYWTMGKVSMLIMELYIFPFQKWIVMGRHKGIRSRLLRTHGTQCKMHGRGYPKMLISSHQHSSQRVRQSKGKRASSIAKKTSACVGSKNCNNRNSHIRQRIKETLSSQTMLKIAWSIGILQRSQGVQNHPGSHSYHCLHRSPHRAGHDQHCQTYHCHHW